MTRQTDHMARASAGRTGAGRQVALAASVALMAVTGTATIAWSALSFALGPELSATAKVAAAAPETQEADTSGFAAATRTLAATPVATTRPPAPVTLSTRSRDAQRLGNAVQPKLFGGVAGADVTPAAPATPAAAPERAPERTATLERTVRPVKRPVRPAERPVERPAAAAAEAVPVAAAAPAPQMRVITVPRSRTAARQDANRLDTIWSVGVFR